MALNTVGIVCALASEARHLRPTDSTLVITTGMGSSAASAGARSLIDAGARALASWGMAGGLDPSVQAGEILLPTEVITADGRVHRCEKGWRERLGATIEARDGRF